MAEPVRGARGNTEVHEASRGQRGIARRSAEARATIPDLELTVDAQLGATLGGWEAQAISLDAALVLACALALREHPRANGSYRDGAYELHARVNVGLAIETEDAYVLATVFDADGKSLTELNDEIGRLAARARAGELSAPELSGSTFSVANPGRYGISSSTPILTPPHAGALAAGTIRQVPVIREGAIVTGRAMTLTLACDHRILFWPDAARFLTRVKTFLEEGSL